MIPITDDNIWLLDLALVCTALGFFILGYEICKIRLKKK